MQKWLEKILKVGGENLTTTMPKDRLRVHKQGNNPGNIPFKADSGNSMIFFQARFVIMST